MGIYDTFVEGGKSVQLKNFDPSMRTFRKGDRVPVEENRYPRSCSFFCTTEPRNVVLIRKGVFLGITRGKKRIIYPLYDCHGTLIASNSQRAL